MRRLLFSRRLHMDTVVIRGLHRTLETFRKTRSKQRRVLCLYYKTTTEIVRLSRP